MSKLSLNSVLLSILFILLSGMVANSKVTMSKRVIQANIEKEYDARVLKMFIGKDQGKPVYFVRVMFNGGNYNTAFQVNTIVIDAISGKRLPQFRHGSSGRQLSGAMKNNPNKQTLEALRGHVWR